MHNKKTNIEKAFSTNYCQQVENVKKRLIITNETFPLIRNEQVFWQGEQLQLFSRQYLNKKISFSKLTDIEATILHCIFTRHHDGYIRQKHLQALWQTSQPTIAVPFVIKLLGEYVLEILFDVEIFFNKFSDVCYQFLLENPKFWATQKRRVVSYWNEYYRYGYNENIIGKRYYERLTNYPIWQFVQKIDSELKKWQ